MRVSLIDAKIHGALVCLGLLASVLSVTALNQALNGWAGTRATTTWKQQQIADIERQAEIDRVRLSEQASSAQHAADNNINQFDSITITGYTCDPSQPPSLDYASFAKSNGSVKVADQNQLLIGEISPNGYFTFSPACAN